jgi:hypothetical protein
MLPHDSSFVSESIFKTYGAKGTPSAANASINLKDWLQMMAGATYWAPTMENDSTIN